LLFLLPLLNDNMFVGFANNPLRYAPALYP
jgi:hypothetical protein